MLQKTYSTLGGGRAWLVWILSTIFVVWLFNLQTGYGLVTSDIAHDTGMLLAQATLAATVYTWAFAIVQFFSGALIDRYGAHPLMAVAVALVTIGTFMFGYAGNFFLLALAQIVMAVGSSFGFVGTGYLGGKWFGGAKFGMMFGLLQAVCSVFSAVNLPFINWLLSMMNWRVMITGYAAFGVVLFVLHLCFVRNPHTPESEQEAREAANRRALVPAVLADLKEGFANRQVVLSSLFAFMSMGAMLASAIIWGPRIITAGGGSDTAASLAGAGAWIGLAVGAPAFQSVAERIGRKPAATWGALAQTVFLAALVFLPTNTGAATVIMVLIGFCAGAHMLGFTIAGESVPGRLVGTSAAIVNAACFIGGGVMMAIPDWMGVDPDSISSLRGVLWTFVVLMGIGFLFCLPLKESLVREPEPATGSAADEEDAGHTTV